MLKYGMRYILLIYTILILLCSPLLYAGEIKTVAINKPQDFRLILYDGNYLDELKPPIILDIESDGFTVEPYVPDYVYTEKPEMSCD